MNRDRLIEKYIITDDKILDLGFLGSKTYMYSHLHRFILKYALDITGVDIDKYRIQKIRLKYADALDRRYICDDVTKLNNVTGKYDIIIAGELIEHLSDPGAFLDLLKTKLSDNGIIIITTPNILSFRHIIRHIINGVENIYRNNDIKYGHVVAFSKVLLERLCIRHGFRIIESKYTIKSNYSGLRGNIEKLISYAWPSMSPSLFIVLKKSSKVNIGKNNHDT